jgi:hypothetical protein
VDVLGRHVMHVAQQRHHRVLCDEALAAARQTRVLAVLLRNLVGIGNRLEALPVGKGAKAAVGGDQIHQMGGSRARQAGDDDGCADFDGEDLRVATQQVLEPQPVGRVAHAIAVDADAADGPECLVFLDARELYAQPLTEILGTKIREPRALARLGEHGVFAERHRHAGRGLHGGLLYGRELWNGEVFDADVAGPVAHGARG